MTPDEVTSRLKKLQIEFWMEEPGRSLREFYEYVIKKIPVDEWPTLLEAMEPDNRRRWQDRLHRSKLMNASPEELMEIAKKQAQEDAKKQDQEDGKVDASPS